MQSVLLAVAALSAAAAPDSADQGVLLDFSATWCGPCRQMNPLVERLKRQGYPIRKVDVDREPDLARKYRISSIPAFVLVVNGKEVTRSVGRQSEAGLKQMMAQIPRAEPQSIARPDDRAADTRAPTPRTSPAVAVSDPPKRGLFPRIKLPLFGGKEKTPPLGTSADERAIFRGNNEEPAGDANRAPQNGPFASSTRIRIKDDGGINFGSGTIISSVPGRTVVLTCGHIFRDLTEESLVEVDLFQGGKAETYVGKVLRYDLEADVGLIAIASDVALPTCGVAAADVGIAANDPVFSIGCDAGEAPTRQNLKVTRLNPYLGPDNIECTGVPVQGRSGGGLFNKQGQIIGVCVAADPKGGRGLYAGLKAVLDLLNDKGEQPPAAAENQLAQTDSRSGGAAAAALDAPSRAPRSSEPRQPAADRRNGSPAVPPQPGADVAAAAAAAAAAGDAGAEVICIIRSHNEPRATSRVVIINRASPKFLAYLRGEMEQQPRPTSHRVPTDDKRQTTQHQSPQSLQPRTDPTRPVVQPIDEAFAAFSGSTKTSNRWASGGDDVLPPTAAIGPTRPRRYRRSAASRR